MKTLISNATLVDGTGADRRTADVLLDGAVIAAVVDAGSLTAGSLTAASTGADRVIDAAGLVLSPGFIDMHAHSDLQLLVNRQHYAKLSQGVTTELLGQDGLSYAPVDDATLAGVREKIAGWNDNPTDFDWNWRTVGSTWNGWIARSPMRMALQAASPPMQPTWYLKEPSGPW